MAIPAAPNSVSFSQIQAEMGGSNPISLNEYYSGGSLVKANLGIFAPNGVPTSGTISVEDFRGAENTSEVWQTVANMVLTPASGIFSENVGVGAVGGGGSFSTSDAQNGREMKKFNLLSIQYQKIAASKGVSADVNLFLQIGGGPTGNPSCNTDLDGFKTLNDTFATYNRSSVSILNFSNSGSTQSWRWTGVTYYSQTGNRTLTFDCN